MSWYYILNEQGEPVPCDVLTFGRWFEGHPAARVIAHDEVDDVMVSTVFLGLDHSLGHGAPMMYETMIFGGPHDEYQDRYSTRAEAVAGHARALAMVNGRGPDR